MTTRPITPKMAEVLRPMADEGLMIDPVNGMYFLGNRDVVLGVTAKGLLGREAIEYWRSGLHRNARVHYRISPKGRELLADYDERAKE